MSLKGLPVPVELDEEARRLRDDFAELCNGFGSLAALAGEAVLEDGLLDLRNRTYAAVNGPEGELAPQSGDGRGERQRG